MGLERGLNRVRCVLTPKRRMKNENINPDQPNTLSGKVSIDEVIFIRTIDNAEYKAVIFLFFLFFRVFVMYRRHLAMIQNMFYHNCVVHFAVKESCAIKKGNGNEKRIV